jgi:hypothetical protein
MRIAALVFVIACGPHPSALPPPPVGSLRPPAAFDAIGDREARSRALFAEVARVLVHPRCVNCHTPDESPRQGDAHAIHDPPVVRGAADRGIPAMPCAGCHQDRNLEGARVPGAPDWRLAPTAMAWLDRTPAQICAQLTDPARNGRRTPAQLQAHLARDPLVAWGWAPGAGRAPAPGSQAALAALARAWIDSGARCPEDDR